MPLDGSDRSASCYGYISPGESASRTLWVGGWVGLKCGLDNVEEEKHLFTVELKILDCPVHSLSL
jgi:hypothetical protein